MPVELGLQLVERLGLLLVLLLQLLVLMTDGLQLLLDGQLRRPAAVVARAGRAHRRQQTGHLGAQCQERLTEVPGLWEGGGGH